MSEDTSAALGALRVDEGRLKNHVDAVVRSSVEETLNGLLDAEAEQICGAQRYERSAERVDSRSGHYERKLETKAGQVTLKVPRLKRLPLSRRSSSAIRGGRPLSKRLWSRCISQECPCGESRT